MVEQRNQRYRNRASKIRDDARPLETHAVHQRPAENPSHHGREQEGPARQARPGGAVRGLQDEPWYRHERQNVPGLGDRVGPE